MSKISKTELKQLAASLYFDLDDQQTDELYAEFESLTNSLKELDSLPADELAPTDYCVKISSHKLREDIAIPNSNPDELLTNATNKKGKFVVVK
jgi:aspartyl/glutamyl-tRNA(Asn/Gln) amidotransferase C subunit